MSAPATLRFQKMNGLGNEIVVIDVRGKEARLTPDMVRYLADRPATHFDQLMVLEPPRTPATEAFVRIYNADGSEVSACGNGTRCVALVLARDSGRSRFLLETAAGVLSIGVRDVDHITVDMGSPRFDWQSIPLSEEFHDTRAIELQAGPIDNPVLHSPSVVNVGNPHAVFWVDDVDGYDLGRFGPLLEHHPIFPEGANISLAEVISRSHIKVRTWERGVGLTKACGTAACASAVSAMRKRLTERTVTVSVPGGDLEIEWTSQNRILMTGPAELESEGEIDLAQLAGQQA